MNFPSLPIKSKEEILILGIDYLKVVFERMETPESKNDIYKEIVEKQDQLINLLLEKNK